MTDIAGEILSDGCGGNPNVKDGTYVRGPRFDSVRRALRWISGNELEKLLF